MRPKLSFLDKDLIVKIVDDAYKTLETQGIDLHHDLLRDKLAGLGCRVDSKTKKVWIKADLVKKCIASCPREVKLWNIAGTAYKGLGGDAVHFTPGSTAIKILEAGTSKIRLSKIADVLRLCKLVEGLEYIDYSSSALVPYDVPEKIGDSIRLYALLKLTTKPIVTGAFSIAGFDVMTDLQLAVRGTREALKAKPFALFSACPTSPLKWSDVTSDNTMKCAELGIPVEFISMPLAGLVAPVTMVGSLVQHTAETLSGVVISQISCPGAPILYGGSPATFDMQTMSARIASLETQITDCAYAEIGKYLGLPTQAYISLSDSRDLDAQAGFESGTGAYLAALTGINSISGPGMLYFESCLSLEKLAFDNEICGMAQRLIKAIEPMDDLPAGPLFDELLRDRNLLAADHTLSNFRKVHYLAGPTFVRGQIDDNTLIPALTSRAKDQVDALVAAHKMPTVLSNDQNKELEKVMKRAAGDYKIGF